MGKYKGLMFKVATFVIVLSSLAMVLVIYISLRHDIKENDRKGAIVIKVNSLEEDSAIISELATDMIKEEGATGEIKTNDHIYHFNTKAFTKGVILLDSEGVMNLKIEETLRHMTLEEKVAQMFFVGVDGISGVKGTLNVDDKFKEKLHDFPVGGVIIFGKNISSEDQLKKLNADLMAEGTLKNIPLFIGIDEEGGSITRISSKEGFDDIKNVGDMKNIGNSGDLHNSYDAAVYIADYLKEYNINLDFAPVADINSNPKNPIIGDRAFGSDPKEVSDMVEAFRKGLNDEGVASCIKHFPGHGDTETDSHKGIAVSNRTLDELKENEFVPYYRAIENDVDMIMVAHICVPKVTGDQTPASLSKIVVTDILRNELGYDGVVITDAMDMKAITDYYGQGEAARLAVDAGCDFILESQVCGEAYNTVLGAVYAGEISEERIDQSVRRILRLKYKYNKEVFE